MQLIELETQSGKIWVNPEQVITLVVSPNRNAFTDLHLADVTGKPITVKGVLTDVAKKVNDALKA